MGGGGMMATTTEVARQVERDPVRLREGMDRIADGPRRSANSYAPRPIPAIGVAVHISGAVSTSGPKAAIAACIASLPP